jgi:IS5 family transposase
MGQKGFWDEQERREKLHQKQPMLKWLNEHINWEDFRPILETIYDKERKSNAGRKPTDVIVMFKMLILQQMYAISDDELEFQVHDRISFMEFLGLGIEDPIPDAKTVWLFRDNLAKRDLVKEVFAQFDDYLREKGYTVEVGQIVDATLIPVPVQRNTRQENKEVKEGKIPKQWAENPHVLRQEMPVG